MVFFSFDTKMEECMTTMPIDNNFLTQRSLQFIGIHVNKSLEHHYNTKVEQLQHCLRLFLLEPKLFKMFSFTATITEVIQ